MTEFFIQYTTFAAPFVSETGTTYVEAASPEAALIEYCEREGYPRTYAAEAYKNADAMHKGHKALARWLSNKAQVVEGVGTGHTLYSESPTHVEVDGSKVAIEDPYAGAIVS